jgi:hypothetical protein
MGLTVGGEWRKCRAPDAEEHEHEYPHRRRHGSLLACSRGVDLRSRAALDYPTEALADCVFGCMASNGQTRESLRRCSAASTWWPR